MTGISRADVADGDFADAEELASDGSVVFLTVSVVSTTSGTQTVVVGTPADGEGIKTSRDHPVEPGDFAVITGTTGGLGDGIFTVSTVVDDTTFTVVESIGTSTGGSVDFLYQPGAKLVGFDFDDQNVTTANKLQAVITDISNASLLDDEPGSLGTTYTITRVGNLVTREKWINTGNSFAIKQIDYTYSANRVSTEVRKVFSYLDGTTIIAQKTLVYAYSGNTITGAAITRNV